MDFTKKQMEYIDSVDGNAHMSAVTIIGELEMQIAHMTLAGDNLTHVILNYISESDDKQMYEISDRAIKNWKKAKE